MSHISPATAARIWKQHAREYLGLTRHLRQQTVLINYNRWVGDRSYRQQIATQLGLTFTDAGIDVVPKTAGGSSFDGARFDGAATQMQVFERWKVYQHDHAFRQLFQPDIVDFARQLFGPLPGTEVLLPS